MAQTGHDDLRAVLQQAADLISPDTAGQAKDPNFF